MKHFWVSLKCIHAFQNKWNLEVLERGKLENPEKNLLEQERKPKKTQPTYWCWCWDLNSSHTVGRQVLSPKHPPNRPFSIYLNSYLAPRLGGIKQKKCIIHYWASRSFLLFYSPKPQIQVRILIYRKWIVIIYKHRETSLSWLSSFSEYLLEALSVAVSSVFISLPHLEWLHVSSHLV